MILIIPLKLAAEYADDVLADFAAGSVLLTGFFSASTQKMQKNFMNNLECLRG